MQDAPDKALAHHASRLPIGWDMLVLLLAAGSASAAAVLDTLAPVLIVVGLLCLVRLERVWRP